MHIIDLDATDWKTPDDFYSALLPELGAPEWHGHNPNALNDSVIWGGINEVNPPLMIRVHHLSAVPEAVANEVGWAKRGIDLGREDFRTQNGRDIEVELQMVP